MYHDTYSSTPPNTVPKDEYNDPLAALSIGNPADFLPTKNKKKKRKKKAKLSKKDYLRLETAALHYATMCGQLDVENRFLTSMMRLALAANNGSLKQAPIEVGFKVLNHDRL